MHSLECWKRFVDGELDSVLNEIQLMTDANIPVPVETQVRLSIWQIAAGNLKPGWDRVGNIGKRVA